MGHETSKNPSYEVFNKNPKPLPRSQALEPTSRASLQGTLKSQINYNCCEECGSSDSNTELLLCNKFYLGFHLFCLTPLTVSVPKGSWLCPTNSNHKKLKFIFQGSWFLSFSTFCWLSGWLFFWWLVEFLFQIRLLIPGSCCISARSHMDVLRCTIWLLENGGI